MKRKMKNARGYCMINDQKDIKGSHSFDNQKK